MGLALKRRLMANSAMNEVSPWRTRFSSTPQHALNLKWTLRTSKLREHDQSFFCSMRVVSVKLTFSCLTATFIDGSHLPSTRI
jgi:hypothetical protein